MTLVGEAVHHRNRRRPGQRHEIVVVGNPGHDCIDIARKDLGGVADRLAPLHLQVVDAQEDRLAAKLGHARLEGDPGSGAGVLEDETERLARQVAMRLARSPHPLDPRRGVEHFGDLIRREVGVDQHVPAPQPGGNRERWQGCALRTAKHDGAILSGTRQLLGDSRHGVEDRSFSCNRCGRFGGRKVVHRGSPRRTIVIVLHTPVRS